MSRKRERKNIRYIDSDDSPPSPSPPRSLTEQKIMFSKVYSGVTLDKAARKAVTEHNANYDRKIKEREEFRAKRQERLEKLARGEPVTPKKETPAKEVTRDEEKSPEAAPSRIRRKLNF